LTPAIFDLQLAAKEDPPEQSNNRAVSALERLFVVHEHDEELQTQFEAWMRRATSLESMILRQQPNAGKTIIEKLERDGRFDDYTLVLLTPTTSDVRNQERG
jgi:predicted nucleotide-binding protein